ncbi:hypothetical protein INR49_024601 [Caranx melampygus]|nr:hypothetical protein INR49_024601 [Caranx melampygus]
MGMNAGEKSEGRAGKQLVRPSDPETHILSSKAERSKRAEREQSETLSKPLSTLLLTETEDEVDSRMIKPQQSSAEEPGAKTIRSMEEKMNDDVTHENFVDDHDEYSTGGNVGSEGYLQQRALHLPLLELLYLPQVSPPLGALLVPQTGQQLPLSIHTAGLLLSVLLLPSALSHYLCWWLWVQLRLCEKKTRENTENT